MKTLTTEQEGTRKGLIVELYERIDYYVNNPSNNLLNEHAQIEEVINKIIEVEKDITAPLPRRENQWNEFTKWCTQNGVQANNFEIKETTGNEFGLFAKSKLSENDLVLEIPRKLFMTNETAVTDSKLDNFAKDPIFQHMPNLVLTFHLINEYNKPNSFWAPYLKTLPSSYSTILYLNQSELEQLKGSPNLDEVIKIKRNIARQYAYFWMKLQTMPSNTRNKGNTFGSYTYELYRWALSTVTTRQNCVPCKANSKNTTFALIPLWDLCNHKEGKMTTDFDTKKDCLVFYSMSDVKPGGEIFNYYGDRNNSDFFLHNGFVYMDHPKDSVRVMIGISKADPLFDLKDALCRKIELSTYGTHEIHHSTKPLNPKILAIVRIFMLGKEELEKWIGSNNSDDLYEKDSRELSNLNDKVKDFLTLRCSLLLKRYPQIDSYLNSNIESIVKCEKKILQSYHK